MFLNGTDNNIEDFLKAMKFIAPEGKDLKYFILPLNTNSDEIMQGAKGNGFEPLMQNTQNRNLTSGELIDNTIKIPGVTDTITYIKRDNKLRQSVSRNNVDPTAVPPEFPITKEVAPNQTQGGNNTNGNPLIKGVQIKPQNAGIKIVESDDNHTDILLKESLGIFPKNTLFHFMGV